MSSGVYNRGKKILSARGWDAARLRVALTTSSYTPDNAHDTMADITNELSGGSYARQVVTQVAAAEDDANDRAVLDAADVTFPTLGLAAGSPKYAILYVEGGGTDATRDLIAWVDLGTPITPDGSDVILRWDATGLMFLA